MHAGGEHGLARHIRRFHLVQYRAHDDQFDGIGGYAAAVEQGCQREAAQLVAHQLCVETGALQKGGTRAGNQDRLMLRRDRGALFELHAVSAVGRKRPT